MRRRSRIARLVTGVMVGAVVLPGVALAGGKVVSGQQTLQIKAHLAPAKAGARNVTLGFHYDYESTTPPQQPPYNVKTITFVMPAGMALNPAAAPACKRSQIDKTGVPSCPSNTIVGHGTVVANATPAISTLITGTATIYNAVNNLGEGQPKGTRNLILWVKTSIGVTQAVPFRVMKGTGGRMELQARFTKPAQPGVSPGSFTIQTIDLSVSHTGRASFITDPPACSGSWPFALTVVNYFGQPSITAHDRVRCSG